MRADLGYRKPWLYEFCERLDVEYSIGIGMNNVLKQNTEEVRQKAVEKCGKTGAPQRLFTGFDYQAGTWKQPRWVLVKCEANAQGTNRRAVVTNRPGSRTLPRGVCDEYSERGENENRNKELKCDLCADRLSDHRYMANCFRMLLHSSANTYWCRYDKQSPILTQTKRLASTSIKAMFLLKHVPVVRVVTLTAAAKRIRFVKAMLVRGGCD